MSARIRPALMLAALTCAGTGQLTAQIAARATFVADGSFDLPAPGMQGPVDPRGIGVAPDGQIHIVDREGQIFVFDANGVAARPYGAGTLTRPMAVAFDEVGRSYVLDVDRKEVHVFSPERDPAYVIGGGRSGVAQINDPVDLAVGPGGFVHVLDKGGAAIRIFGRDGAFVRNLDLRAAFSDPTGIAVDGDGRILISDRNTSSRVLELPPFHTLPWIGTVTAAQVDLGSAAQPMAIAVDGSGIAVVLDGREQQLWDGDRTADAPRPQGRALYGGTGSGRGSFRQAADIAFATEGHLVILDREGRKIERIRIAAATGRTPLEWSYGIRVSQLPPDMTTAVVAIGGSDPAAPLMASVRATNVGTAQVSVGSGVAQAYNDFYGERFETFAFPQSGTAGTFHANFSRVPAGMALNDTLLFVVEPDANRFSVHDLRTGSGLGVFGDNYEDDRRLRRPSDAAMFSDASVVIADRGNGRMAGFSSDLASLLASFPFLQVAGVAISPSGELLAWNADGGSLSRIPLDGAPPQPLPADVIPGPVQDVTFDAEGHLFLLEKETSRVTIVDPAIERIIIRLGGRDPDFEADRVSVDGAGNIYVASTERSATLVYRWDRLQND